MKFISMIILSVLWGLLSVEIAPAPACYYIAFLGGAMIGMLYPSLYDKLNK